VPIENIRHYHILALLDDLQAREKQGLEDEQCDLIKAALAKLSNAAAEIPDGSFYSRIILAETEKMAEAFQKWNGIVGEDKLAAKKRRAALRKLRSQRQRLAKRLHLNHFVLQN
jgi:hypothetical protein